MASLSNLVSRGFVYNAFKGLERLSIIDCTKHYSVFPKSMKAPVFKHDDQLVLEEEKQLQKLSLQGIKPAFSDDTCSEFHDSLVRKFSNYIMRKGQRNVADDVVRKCFRSIKRMQIELYNKAETQEEKDEIELDPISVLHKAVENSSPALETVKMRRGGVKYDVPHPVSANRSRFLGMNWLIEAAKNKERTVSFWDTLARELVNASNNTGSVVKRKQEMHKSCEANRAYAHFRWT